MSSEWPVSELGKEAINASRSFSFKNNPKVVFVNTGDVLLGKFLHSDVSDGSTLPGQAKKSIRLDDILLTEIRPGNGRYAYVDFDADKYVVSTKFMVIESLGRVSPRFLYHILTNQAALDEFQRIAESRSGTFPQITFDSITHFLVPVPPKIDQENLVKFFDGLDDRITLLRETNATLEAIAQALFKSWFVDFDPVHANAAARAGQQNSANAHAGTSPADSATSPDTQTGDAPQHPPQALDPATAALFPDGFEESELGLVPKGWMTQAIYDMATYINGAAYKVFEPNSERRGLPIIKIAELKAGVTSQTAFSNVSMPEKYLIKTGDILFSWSGNPDTSIDTFVWGHDQALLNQHIFRVLPHIEVERSFVLQMLRNLKPVFAELARNKQTTGLGHVTVADLKRIHVVNPPRLIIEQFNALVEPIHQMIFGNERQAQTLTQLRDTLLPRLISGQLRLPEIESKLSEEVSCV